MYIIIRTWIASSSIQRYRISSIFHCGYYFFHLVGTSGDNSRAASDQGNMVIVIVLLNLTIMHDSCLRNIFQKVFWCAIDLLTSAAKHYYFSVSG